MSGIQENFKNIDSEIDKSTKFWERKRSDITLVAVSKKQPLERIEAALEHGHRVFGENRVGEAQDHWVETGYKDNYPDIRLHLIGPLQSNKVKAAVQLFDVIETVDRKSLIDALAKHENLPELPELYVQVNTGEEPQKSGVLPKDLDDLLSYAAQKNVQISGLMCIPPVNEAVGLHFSFLKSLADKHDLQNISMGMSGDYDRAIACGATHIRLGSALFGARV